MARFINNSSARIEQPPGSLIFTGEKKMNAPVITLFEYNMDSFYEQPIHNLHELSDTLAKEGVSWININGLHDTQLIETAGLMFSLHPLTLEDIVHTGQRPKMEEFDSYLFFTMKMMYYNEQEEEIESEQLSVVLGNGFVLTLQERPGDVFESIRNRIRKNRGKLRKSGNDYLAYVLIDTVVDNYIYIIERLGEKIELIEDLILDNQTHDILLHLNDYKREMNYLRKTVRPVKEFCLQFARLDTDMIQETTTPFLKDLLDLSTQAVEIIDTYRDMLSDHLAIYNTMINNKLNEIMKVLTIFSTIFIPLTFVAGIYGTNFEYLPELTYRYAYFIFWGVLLLIASGMLLLFKKKKWL